ncbi:MULTISPECIES: M23 family metallopeptidase [unclassified Virgibacillus]|uniref:M23 family metallopeptidase n=1 Tax=unclassified Virgibacillus TaxID=2620237 RepID=UPI0024DE6570|nr:M23 family metallopeptidase [Virgibacillus sp. LDC-1]
MNRGVQKVRKSITKRKKIRNWEPSPRRTANNRKIVSPIPQDEEKHGYYKSFVDNTELGNRRSQLVTGVVLKGILSVMLFFAVALLWQTDSVRFSSLQSWTSYALTEEFPFAKVNQWYRTTFGSPMGISPQQQLVNSGDNPLASQVSGNVKETFQVNGKGIRIAPEKSTNISSLRDGIVIFAGQDRKTNKTVIVQHADDSKSIYGNLSSIDVHLYQSVVANQRIGNFKPTVGNDSVYIAIEKDKQYIDPIQVIKVDDSP